MAKIASKLFSRKFRNWLLHLVVSRQGLKAITGYTLQAKIGLLQPLYDGFDASLIPMAGLALAVVSKRCWPKRPITW